MHAIEQSVEVLGMMFPVVAVRDGNGNITGYSPENDSRGPERLIERGGRVCYRSEDRITEDSAGAFVEMVCKRQHESVLEHSAITVLIESDIGIFREALRSRHLSPSQESTRYCVVGSTALSLPNHRQISVAELYARKEGTSANGAWRRVKIRRLNEATGLLEYSTIKDVVLTGVKPTVCIKTKLGYDLCLTADHRVRTSTGYKPAGELGAGDCVAVNGDTELYRNREWMAHQYTTLDKPATVIASQFGFNVSTVKSWIRKHKLPSKPKSYWNKGRTPWNKGMVEGQDPRVDAQINALRTHHWNGGHTNVSAPRATRVVKPSSRTYHKLVGSACEICSKTGTLIVHHVDEDRDNNCQDNLMTLCTSCHGGVHNRSLEVVRYDPVVQVTSGPTTEVYDIEMPGPSHNFVANGIVVHNCGYSKSKFGGGDIGFLHPIGLTPEQLEFSIQAYTQAEANYNQAIALGMKPEEARDYLPLGTKSEVVLTGNFRAWVLFLSQRLPKTAHPKIRCLAKLLWQAFKVAAPTIFNNEKFGGLCADLE